MTIGVLLLALVVIFALWGKLPNAPECPTKLPPAIRQEFRASSSVTLVLLNPSKTKKIMKAMLQVGKIGRLRT
jgi:hypothetical protein